MERTKLVGTMGPASENKDVLRELFKAGLNVARMNFSHGDHAEHLRRLTTVRELNEELGTNVALMLDTKGPEMRTNEFENGAVTIEKDSLVTLHFEEILGTEKAFSINYPGLYDDVQVGTVILVDDGYLQTEVISKDDKTRTLVVKAKNTHKIKNRRGVNVPNTLVNMPFLSQKDINDIIFGAEQKVDFIAASFVQHGDNINQIRELLKENNSEDTLIIAKIENQAGIDNLDSILEASDGIMVARGDLGVEILPEDLPHYQKEMVERARQMGKLVIVATQMVESMQNNPVPTRAEVSDVANAVYDSADSVMLSGEMAAGKYPLESVQMMKRIVTKTQDFVEYDQFLFPLEGDNEDLENLSFMAAVSAANYHVAAVVVDNYKLARVISKYRVSAPVVAVVNNVEAPKANLFFGVYPVLSQKEVDNKLVKLGVEKEDTVLYITNNKIEIKKF